MNIASNILSFVTGCACNVSTVRLKEVVEIANDGLKAAPSWHGYPSVVGGMIAGAVSGVGLVLASNATTPQQKIRSAKILAAGAAIYLMITATNVHYFFLQGCKELAKQTDFVPQAICRSIIPYCQC